MVKISNFKELVRSAPKELQTIIWQQWKAPQNPKHHPEGNTLKHINVVVNRAIKEHPDDIDIILSALFHDLGKYHVLGFKNDQPTAHGHEKISVKFVDEFADWIKSMGGNVDKIRFIVANHMKVKSNVWDVMKPTKKDIITKDPNFEPLQKFTKLDKGGLREMVENITNDYIGKIVKVKTPERDNKGKVIPGKFTKVLGTCQFFGPNPHLDNELTVVIDRMPIIIQKYSDVELITDDPKNHVYEV